VLGPGVALHYWEGQRHRPVGGRHRAQPVAGAEDQVVEAEVAGQIHGTSAGYQQDVEGDLHVDGQAGRAALIGFEAMAEPAVWVAVGPNGVDHAGGVGAVEQYGREAALDEAPLTIEEGPAGSEDAVAHSWQFGMSPYPC
jgi:hypothetical protein